MFIVFVFRITVNQAAITRIFGKIIKIDQKPGFYLAFLQQPEIISTKLQTTKIVLRHSEQSKPNPFEVEVIVNYKVTEPSKSLDVYYNLERFVKKETV